MSRKKDRKARARARQQKANVDRERERQRHLPPSPVDVRAVWDDGRRIAAVLEPDLSKWSYWRNGWRWSPEHRRQTLAERYARLEP